MVEFDVVIYLKFSNGVKGLRVRIKVLLLDINCRMFFDIEYCLYSLGNCVFEDLVV